jgi:hypothetical protein
MSAYKELVKHRAQIYIQHVNKQLDSTTDPAKQRQLRTSLSIFKKAASQ